ncbi:MAG TPA: adaptor protein MecA [Ruminiclostridium sp.]|nr:adaptor protein MecA [Ruminiclostridium sp.]
MNIQKIGPDRLRIQLDPKDLDKYDLDYYSISKESPGTQRLLKEILSEAQRDGFSTQRCKLLLEVLPGKNSGCIIYITKSQCEAVEKHINAKNPKKHSGYVFSCDNLEDAINAIGHFADFPDLPIQNSALYCFNEKYYLVFLPVSIGLDRDRLAALLAALSEYGSAESCTAIYEAMLEEHGTIILKTRAIENFIRYFHC